MKKLFIILMTSLLAVGLILCFSGCDDDTSYCTVTWNYNCAEAIEPVTEKVKEGSFLKGPEAPERAGYICIAWCRDEACTELFVFDTDTVTEDITLYAKWIENKCLIFKGKGSFLMFVTSPGWMTAEHAGKVYYSKDAVNWSVWKGLPVAAQKSSDGFCLYFRGTRNFIIAGNYDSRWQITEGTAGCYGNIMTLLNYENPDNAKMDPHCYENMFVNCTGLTSAPELPAADLSDYCYESMFEGCTGLTEAPELSSINLAASCYRSMFSGCTGLTYAPELPAINLAASCYESMFSGCTGLTSAPELPAINLAASCYESMFRNCTGLTSAPELPAADLSDYCYESMFVNCTGLTSAPELPAADLAASCYRSMFYGCTGLTSAPELPAETLADYCYESMFWNCTGLTSAPELPAINLAASCYESMFWKCTGLTSAPDLSAETLAYSCYEYMFYGCTGLKTVPELPAVELVNYCYFQMFSGCSSLKINDTGAGTLFLRMPSDIPEGAVFYMFNGTGGSFTGDPVAGGTYYYE